MPAEKRFTVFRAPNVATFQLKRFDYNRIFGGKITKQISYPETLNLRPYMSESRGDPINYRLFAVLVHLGGTSNSGHYFCYVRSATNNWYLMDDARVSQTNLSKVLDQQAYMLFYVQVPKKDGRNNSINKSLLSSLEKLHDAGSPLAAKPHKPNGLINNGKLDPARKLNLPKLICENVNTPKMAGKQNGESKPVNSSNSSSNNPLSDLESRINSNLSSLNKSTPAGLSNGKPTTCKPEERKVEKLIISKKRLVPYENNSSDDEDASNNSTPVKRQKMDGDRCNGPKEGISLLKKSLDRPKTAEKVANDKEQRKSKEDDSDQNDLRKSVEKRLKDQIISTNEAEKNTILNGFASMAKCIGDMFGSDVLKDIDTMPKDLELSPETKEQSTGKQPAAGESNGHPAKPIITVVKSKPAASQEGAPKSKSLLIKIPLFRNEQKHGAQLTPTKTAANNRTYSPVKMNGWVVGQSPLKCKTSSIASGSSTNSINSTTEWQVIDRDSALGHPKKDVKRAVDSSWQVADRRSHSADDSDGGRRSSSKPEKSNQSTNSDSDDERHNNSSASREAKLRHKNELTENEHLSEAERLFMKRLRKIERKDQRKYDKLRRDPDAMQSLFHKLKRKLKKKRTKKQHHHSSSEEEREERKSKKRKHRRDRASSEERSPVTNHSFYSSHDSSEQQSSGRNSSSRQSKVISPQKNGMSNQFNETFGYGKQKDTPNELNEMHLNLLGKNGK